MHRTALKASDSPFILDPFEDLFKRIPRFVFVTGKGGVGKTSLSCALAVNLAERGRAVLLVSTDPASNLDEVLQTPLGASPTPISGVPGLRAMNINPSAAAAVYRESVVAPYRAALPAEVVSNIEEQLSGACTVEIAAFNEFAALMDDTEATGAFEHIIFDTAPSGHTLRLLALPAAWTDFLQGSPVGASCLGPLQGLAAYKDRYERVLQALRDPSLTLLTLVARAQAATLQEAARTGDELAGLGLKNQCLVINAVMTAARDDDPLAQSMLKQTQEALREIPKSLRDLDRWTIALKPKQVLGLEQLRQVFSAPGVVAEDAASSLPMAHNHCPDLDALIARLAVKPPDLDRVVGERPDWNALESRARAVPAGCAGVRVMPFVHAEPSLGVNGPRFAWTPSEPADAGVRFRASLEALACLIALGLRAHRENGQVVERVSVSGGIARCGLMLEILASMIGLPV
ncbi:MAG: hypothetical protein EBS16_00410, partial [Betaproteobacteria bacterium]|nr:hypothetical protein [Betaproteobacteria bacterium]